METYLSTPELLEVTQAYLLCSLKIVNEINIFDSTLEAKPKILCKGDYLQTVVLRVLEKYFKDVLLGLEVFISNNNTQDFFAYVNEKRHFDMILNKVDDDITRNTYKNILSGIRYVPILKKKMIEREKEAIKRYEKNQGKIKKLEERKTRLVKEKDELENFFFEFLS
ncbi:hypothetical protein SteCoe_17581 [Stentor coeruleus]|uniref:Uncharacterized protein n=1 Tax=Stentor coeruleus TaxID=5963 RepID=A0A1R2BYM0_9CILI|nr:hypothetical protein SteCoe_17581 [Stentor coeruleus]